MKVREVMGRVVEVPRDLSGYEAIQFMLGQRVRKALIAGNVLTIRDLVYHWEELEKPATFFSTSDVLFVHPDTEIGDAVRIMTAKAVGSLVVGDRERVYGILSDRDVIGVCRVPEGEVADIMDVAPLFAGEEALLRELVSSMRKSWRTHVSIVDDHQVIGVISISDIAKYLAKIGKSLNVRASEVMTRDVVKVTPESKISTVRRLMVERKIGYLPVVDSRALLGSVEVKEILALCSLS